MRASFEEKTYENYFNAELDRKSSIFFPLGQVQEGNLGFDSSAFSANRRLWRRVGHPFWFHPHFDGLELREIANEMEHFLGIVINDIPRMKVNLLFQYKKPEYITISTGKEWKHWHQPYYRYDIYKEQQDLLNEIHRSFSKRILILYAAPTIPDINELITIKMNNQIIQNSNFKKAADLSGHHRNTYINSGTFSIACSDPVPIENINLLEELNSFDDNSSAEKDNQEDNSQFIINFRKQIVSLTYENKYYGNTFRRLNEDLDKITNYELFHSFLVMINFNHLTGIQWLIRI